MRLEGKCAVVTGSSTGIGRSIALDLAAHGARVVVNARGEGTDGRTRMDEVVEAIQRAGGKAVGFAGAVDDPATADALVTHCVNTFGKIDILVNNAGIIDAESLGPIDRCSTEVWRRTMSVNLDAVFYTCRAALPHMMEQQWGRIVNAASSAGLGMQGASAYPASKSGLFGFTRAIASGYGPYGITANAYNPEAFTTMAGMTDLAARERLIRGYEDKGVRTPTETEYLLTLGGPEGVAPWITYLCSDESDYLNGQVFAVEARRVALIAWPEEERVLFRDAASHGPWQTDDLSSVAPMAFPLHNRWPRREGDALRAWERAWGHRHSAELVD